jgi:hypothetical protein
MKYRAFHLKQQALCHSLHTYFVVAVASADAEVTGIVVVLEVLCVTVGRRVGGSDGITEATAEPTADTPGTLLATLQPQSMTTIIAAKTTRTMICFIIVFTFQVKY